MRIYTFWAMRHLGLNISVLLVSVLVLPVLFCGCALWPSASDWKRCRFQVASLQFEGVRENQTEWKLDLAVHNPNPRRLKLESLKLFALHDRDTLATLRSVQPLELPPQDSAHIDLEVDLPDAAWKKVLGVRDGGPAQITVVGDAFFHTMFGVRKFSGALRKTYDIDLATAMGIFGGKLFEGLLSQ